jgi:signal transduction histidine kinase
MLATRGTVSVVCRRSFAMRHRNVALRLGACLLVALAMMAGHHAGLDRPLDNQVLGAFLTSTAWSSHLPRVAELAIIAFCCLAPAIVRMEQPLVMLAFGSGMAFVFFLISSLMLLALDIALPMAASLIGLFVSTGAVEMQSWGDERRRRRALEQLDKSKQQFTDMLVHDLKRRMSSILMSLSALESRTAEADERSRELMATMRASAERMLLLTGNLLDVRRMEESRMPLYRERVSLRNMVLESVKDLRQACSLTGATIEATGQADAELSLDRGVFLRIMANLLWNSLQYGREGSAIEVGYGLHAAGTAFVEVANHGPCIPPDGQARLFSAFASSTSGPGDSRVASTGLGLAFCKLAVEAHGGSIAIESPWRPHADGVLVRILLPVVK